MSSRTHQAVLIGAAALALASAVALQALRDRIYPPEQREAERMLYVPSGAALQRLALDFDALAADTYWIRAIQHYGGDRLARERRRKYELLYPLLDITTTLDPYFTIAYRFGAIFLSEPFPGGPGRPDYAIALLQKGIQVQPTKWQYDHDIGFVYYWSLRDYKTAAQWFERASRQPNAPNWLAALAASVLQVGQDRTSARMLWQQMLAADQEWLRHRAERGLRQLDALDQIDQLDAIVHRYPPRTGEQYSWSRLVRVRVLPGIPLDPAGAPYDLDPVTGQVRLSSRSELFPLPEQMRRPG